MLLPQMLLLPTKKQGKMKGPNHPGPVVQVNKQNHKPAKAMHHTTSCTCLFLGLQGSLLGLNLCGQQGDVDRVS
jgi:hypothetical protein